MSEYCREQHPLLCEEASEEEPYSPRYYRRIRPLNYRGRARNNLKGAAAIFTRWTDHWTSFLTYWWIGIGMISLTTFIIYNCLFAFSMLPTANMKPASLIVVHENEKTSVKSLPMLPEVYMHLFVSQKEDIDLNQYIPYIEIIADTFSEYKFLLIVLINDTNIGWMSAEENNELALNMLWTKDKNSFEKQPYSHNINIEHISLSTYMDNSPLKKYWRALPYQLIEFVARTVSIWEKGGIAFNPDILNPKYQHALLYVNKLQKILNTYAHTNKVIDDIKFRNKPIKDPKIFRKLNNIRDIIEALEGEDISANAFSQQTLSEAENRDISLVRHERQVSTATESIKNAASDNAKSLNTINPDTKTYTVGNTEQKESIVVNSTVSPYTLNNNHNSTKMSLLPLFLEFLFHNKADSKSKTTEVPLANRKRKSAILPHNHKENSSLTKNVLPNIEKDTNNMYKPLVVSAAGIYNKSKYDADIDVSRDKDDSFETNRLIIDIKGNIIATDVACHAFLGTVFSNVIHHSDEVTITDFIIAELTIFCNGLLSTCMGIDLILL